MLDIIFISYAEPNADNNWQSLKRRFPFAKRLHGVKGIHNAHINAAKMSFTSMFWIVDGDSEILDSFNFELPDGLWEESVYVYRALNPVNDLTYGYGGIKLFPKIHTMNMSKNNIDMTTSITKNFTAVDVVASKTNFNTDEFNSWKSAFRECVKLSSKSIQGQVDNETEQRLDDWCSKGADRLFGEFVIQGAIAGKEYGTKYKDNLESLKNINDFAWLADYFKQRL